MSPIHAAPLSQLQRRLERLAAQADDLLRRIREQEALHEQMFELGRQIDARWAEFHSQPQSDAEAHKLRQSIEQNEQARIERLRARTESTRHAVGGWIEQARQVLATGAELHRGLLPLAEKVQLLRAWERSPEQLRMAVLRALETLDKARQILAPVLVHPSPQSSESPSQPEKQLPTLLTVKEAADLLTIAPKTLYRLAERGLIPYVRLGRNIRFRQAEIERWIEMRTVRPRRR